MPSASANEQLKAILRAGKLFEGKYRIMRPLGAGSFAVVVHGRHEVMERDVALKFLKPKVVDANPEVSERFVKEVQIASRLHHPNVVAIYDFGKTEDGIYYMVQEFVNGVTVDELMPPGRPLEHDRVVDITRQVLSCLEEAHSHGVIHRDLKPSNLMSTTTDEGIEVIKILDFGVAKLLDKTAEPGPERQSTKFIGTPIYMSPEQILGREVGPSSDLYSVGLMLYEMITGQAPIQADQIAEVVQQHLSDRRFDFPMLHLLDPNLQRVILKATERYPEDRFANAAEFQVALVGLWGEAEMDSADTEIGDANMIGEALGSIRDTGANKPVSKNKGFVRGASALEEASEEDELDAFLGKNYIGPAVEELESSFAPLPPEEQRAASHLSSSTLGFEPEEMAEPKPAPKPAPAPKPRASKKSEPLGRVGRARPTTSSADKNRAKPGDRPAPKEDASSSALTDLRNLELDMDALRSVQKDRQRGARNTRPSDRRQQAEELIGSSDELQPMDIPLFLAALIAAYIAFVLLSAVTDLMPGAARVFIGLLPIPLAIGWVAIEGRSVGSLHERWLRPVAVRVLILLACAFLMIGVVIPDKATLALKHEGTWFYEALPQVAPLTWFASATRLMTDLFSVVFGGIASIMPW